jgi:hypothetical protein
MVYPPHNPAGAQIARTDAFERSRIRLSYFGGLAATGYVAAAVAQRVIRALFLGSRESPAEAILVRVQTADQVRATLVLVSIFLSLVVFVAIGINRVKRAPGAVALGLASGVLFVAMEIWYRSIDLFLVSQRWAHAYRQANIETPKQQLLQRVTDWEHLVEALYFSLLLALFLSVTSFAVALGRDSNRWVRLACLGWVLYGASVLLRLLGGYAGLDWLEPFNSQAYLPCAVAGYGLTALWLWHEARLR